MGAFIACTAEDPIQIYAAASIAPVAQHILKENSDIPFLCNVASSSILARQIAAGAPADIYLSASTVWTSYLENKENIATRKSVAKWNGLRNSLVLITNKKNPHSCSLQENKTIAIADWKHVPAGMYAREALEKLHIFEQLAPHLLATLDVHAVLTYVARGDVPCGIVYKSDTFLSDEVLIVPSALDNISIDILYSFLLFDTSEPAGTLFHHLTLHPAAYQQFGFSVISEMP